MFQLATKAARLYVLSTLLAYRELVNACRDIRCTETVASVSGLDVLWSAVLHFEKKGNSCRLKFFLSYDVSVSHLCWF